MNVSVRLLNHYNDRQLNEMMTRDTARGRLIGAARRGRRPVAHSHVGGRSRDAGLSPGTQPVGTIKSEDADR